MAEPEEEFKIPTQERDLLSLESNDGLYHVKSAEEYGSIVTAVNLALRTLADDPESIATHDVFDPLFHFIAGSDSMNAHDSSSLLGSLVKCVGETSRIVRDADLANDREETAHLRKVVKMGVFLLAWLMRKLEISAVEKAESEAFLNPGKTKKRTTSRGKGKKGGAEDGAEDDADGEGSSGIESPVGKIDWNSESGKERALEGLLELIDWDALGTLWQFDKPEEEFLVLFVRVAFLVAESSSNMRSGPVRRLLCSLLCALVKRYDAAVPVASAALRLLHKCEHSPVFLGAVYSSLAQDFGRPQAVTEAVKELTKISPVDLARENLLAKNVGLLLVDIAEKSPEAVLPCIGLLIPHLETGESYVMRNGIIQVLANLARYCFKESCSPDSPESIRRTSDSLLDMIEKHVMDINSFCRSKALQVLVPLFSDGAIPLKHFGPVVSLAAGRLRDKTSTVRRSAMILLGACLQYNPFGANLSETLFEEKAEACRKLFADVGQNPEEEEGMENDDVVNAELAEKLGKERIESVMERTPLNPRSITPEETLPALRRLYMWATQGTQVAKVIGEAVKKVSELMSSKSTTDVIGAIEFLVTARQLGIKAAGTGIRSMLGLVWSQEKQICDAVREAYDALYFRQPRSKLIAENLLNIVYEATDAELLSLEELMRQMYSEKKVPPEVVKILFDHAICTDASLVPRETRRSAIKVLGIIASSDPKVVAEKMGSVVATTLTDRWYEDVETTYYVCVLLANLRKNALEGDKAAEAEKAKADAERIGSTTAAALDSSGPGKKKRPGSSKNEVYDEEALERALIGESNKEDVPISAPGTTTIAGTVSISRLSNGHNLFDRLAAVVTCDPFDCRKDMCPVPYSKWAPVAEQAINAIAFLAQNPDRVFESSIRKLHLKTFGTENMSNTQSLGSILFSDMLARLLFVVGHCAVKFLGHVELVGKHIDYCAKKEKEAKKRLLQESKEAPSKKRGRKGERSFDESEESSASDVGQQDSSSKGKKGGKKSSKGLEEGGSMDAESEAVPGDDTEGLFYQGVAESQMMGKGSLFGAYADIIVAACLNKDGVFGSSPVLRGAAILALCKFMCAGGDEFCKQHMQLFATLLERTDNPGMRATLVVTFGDLCARYPNTTESWTGFLFERLRDEDADVRRNAVSVLAHLIINDIIKVKGQVSGIALSMEDEDPRVSAIAKLFFNEISKKGNAIYNAIPDIISNMSNLLPPEERQGNFQVPDENNGTSKCHTNKAVCTREMFRRIMAFIFGFLQKERQFETLLDKLCARLKVTNDPRGVAYCLSLLSYNDKCIRRLIELAPTYKNALHDNDVYESFCAIVSKSRKFIKADMKASVDELENRIEIARGTRKATEGDEFSMAEDVEPVQQQPADGTNKSPTTPKSGDKGKSDVSPKKNSRSSKNDLLDDIDDDDDDEDM